ncbi:hypothetical protein KZO75_02935 [Prevotella histicola]|nr:hypothetical protein [Prevotella histicola]
MKDMNIDDKTINLSTEEAKTCGKSVETDIEDEAIKAKLNAVYRLRLLYNSGEELWKHIGKAGSGNNSFGRVGGKDAFLRRAVFHELEREWYDETGIILNGLLDAYAQAAKLMERYNPLHEDEEEGVRVECCEQIINVCVFDDEITDKQDAKMRELLLRLQEEDTYCLAVLLLMLFGVLPSSFDTRQGDARQMKGKYELVYNFFLRVCHRNILFVQTPRMTLFHKALKESEENLTRIRLVKFTADVLCNLSILASAEQIAENGRRVQWDQLYPDLDGCWLSEQHSEQCPDYWQVEELATSYLFCHYFQKEGEVGKLHQQEFTISFYQNEEDYACVQHPRSVLQWLNNEKLSKDDITYPHFVLWGGERPTKIAFESFMMDVSWFRPMQLTRAKGDWMPPTEKGVEVVNDFAAYSYTFYLGLEAITPDFIYVKDENGKSYKVSVSEHEELRNCTLSDAIGIITWADKRYIAFDHLMLYLPIDS